MIGNFTDVRQKFLIFGGFRRLGTRKLRHYFAQLTAKVATKVATYSARAGVGRHVPDRWARAGVGVSTCRNGPARTGVGDLMIERAG